ncbi:MAG: glutamate racemase, partial [Planctomycetota bacterium]
MRWPRVMPNSVRRRGSVAGWVAACVAACLAGHAAEPSADPLAPPVEPIVRHATSSPDGSAAFTFVPADLAGDTRHLPIGVFDSGIGGLTVLEAILAADDFDNRTLEPGPDGRPDFAGERFVYLGDQANMPYGNYPREGNVAFLRELILKDAVFLLGRRSWPVADAVAPVLDKPPVKAIVIACNTATAYGLDDIRAAIRAWGVPVPVVGVVEAGARGVLQSAHLAAGRDEAVAVLATVGTCASMAYPKAIGAAFGRAGRPAPAVVQQGFADLAAAIEGDPAVAARTSV